MHSTQCQLSHISGNIYTVCICPANEQRLKSTLQLNKMFTSVKLLPRLLRNSERRNPLYQWNNYFFPQKGDLKTGDLINICAFPIAHKILLFSCNYHVQIQYPFLNSECQIECLWLYFPSCLFMVPEKQVIFREGTFPIRNKNHINIYHVFFVLIVKETWDRKE